VAQITAIDPATAGRAGDDVFGLACGWIAEAQPRIFAAREIEF
jgi:hypothetical protein